MGMAIPRGEISRIRHTLINTAHKVIWALPIPLAGT
mgnify:CR=1 FL=1